VDLNLILENKIHFISLFPDYLSLSEFIIRNKWGVLQNLIFVSDEFCLIKLSNLINSDIIDDKYNLYYITKKTL